MKKIVGIFLAFFLLLALCACAETETGTDETLRVPSSEREPEEKDHQKTVETGSPEDSQMVITLNGYDYYFAEYVLADNVTAGGATFEGEKYKIYIFSPNLIPFSSWETVEEDSASTFMSAVFSAFRITPLENTPTSSERITNSHGEEMLRMEGSYSTDIGADKDYILYFHAVDESYVRFFIGFYDGDKTELDNAMKLIAENLQKTAE